MRAYVQNLISGDTGYIRISCTIYNGDTAIADTNIPFAPSSYTTEAAMHNAIIANIISWAAGQDITLTATDIFFNGIMPRVFEDTTWRLGAISYSGHATVASGVAVFHLTDDGLSTGNPIFPNGIIADSINPVVNDSTGSFQMSWALSNSNKTVTVTANKYTTANILSGILGQSAANGSVVQLQAWGY